MNNNSKQILGKKGYTYKELAFILNITERQAMNILNKENKSIFNYLVLSELSGEHIENMFSLTNKEKETIIKRVEALRSTLE